MPIAAARERVMEQLDSQDWTVCRQVLQTRVIVAINSPNALDPALLRCGRLDLQLLVDLPNLESRLAILLLHNLECPLQNVNLAYWAAVTEG